MKINLPYISFPKFALFFTIIFSVTLFIQMWFDFPEAEKNSKIDYIGRSPESISDTGKQIKVISDKLEKWDYWDEHWWHWWDLLSHAFYAYSLVNIYLQDKTDEEFRKFASSEIESAYEYTITDWRDNFTNNTKIPYWIIYQWNKNQILASLIIIWKDEYKKEFYENSDWLASELEKSREFSWESYEELWWYVDNINAYYSLYLADMLRIKSWEPKKYDWLIKNWLRWMNKHIDNKWIIVAEAYSVWTWLNQSRWCAQAWVLAYLYEIDKASFDKQYDLFNRYFFDEKMSLWLVRDVPKWEKLENLFLAWPSLFWYSSSATALSLPLYRLARDEHKFQKILKTLEFLLSYDLEKWDYTSWKSTLLSSLLLWWKTHTSWWDKI
ncbi:MAG: hypothetical protein ACD_2C00201G0006 [uncultured bacterium (gcode 4)]|uniref:Uncharacterized protein n=1 Tax=uncultured bacterium (gcode 4) TaxID=1234023 RepID=K2GFY0_9BACT|nr:MAG: hypothetical protein ACD_2C00201G0006 [uncultured bacterium (gcode 4)]